MTQPVDPARLSVAQIREIGQPPAIRGRRSAEHWTADVYLRKLSPYVTRALLPTGISANGVTVLMIAVGWSAAAALLIPGLPGAVLAAVMGQAQMLVDCCDGEVARVRGTTSSAGVFLDKIGHYTTEGLIPIALGVRAAGGFTADSGWILLGTLLAVVIIWNKALNDMADATRYQRGLPKQEESPGNSTPQAGLLGTLRRMARFVPFYRMFHSVEMTLLILVAAVGDAIVGDLAVTRGLLIVLLPLAAMATLGHALSIMASNRLR
jgi:CDP-alcohol phosphatidyltransferase